MARFSLSDDYAEQRLSAISSLMNAARDNAEVQSTLKIDAKARIEAYVDDFTLTKSDIERESLAYFVDCGDHDLYVT